VAHQAVSARRGDGVDDDLGSEDTDDDGNVGGRQSQRASLVVTR